MSPEEWAEELILIEEEESDRQKEINAFIQYEEDILFRTQNELLRQEGNDELFWEEFGWQELQDESDPHVTYKEDGLMQAEYAVYIRALEDEYKEDKKWSKCGSPPTPAKG